MRTYRKIWISDDMTVASSTDIGTAGAYAVILPHTKNSIIGVWNFFAGINPGMAFGGPVWAVVDFNPPFNARVHTTFEGPQLAQDIFTLVPYGSHPKN